MRRIPLLIIVLMTVATIFYSSCQQEENVGISPKVEYLTIEHDIVFNKLTKDEKIILQKAILRLNFIKTKDGSYTIMQKSAKEVGISENIFNFFKAALEATARRDILTRSNIASDDSIGETEGNKFGDRDCVIYTVAAILDKMNITGYTIDKIRTQLTIAGYYVPGQGTYVANIRDALTLFFNVYEIDQDEYNKVDPINNNYFVVQQKYFNGHYYYHALSAFGKGDGGLACTDEQAAALGDTGTTYILGYDEISSIYRLTKK